MGDPNRPIAPGVSQMFQGLIILMERTGPPTQRKKDENLDRLAEILPTVNASLNGLATVLLLWGFCEIKRGRELRHRNIMLSAFGVSVVFLISYVIYHLIKLHQPFAGVGAVRLVYFAILISHIILAAMVPVLAILTIYFGLRDQRARHRRLARWTFPIWLYVSVTGVVIYLMLYHWPVSAESLTMV